MALYLWQGKKSGKICSRSATSIHSVVREYTATFAVVYGRDVIIQIQFYKYEGTNLLRETFQCF